MRIDNTSGDVHPMHLHGHRLLVLSRNGVPSTGSPWWVDSLDVLNGGALRGRLRGRQPPPGCGWTTATICRMPPRLMTHLSYAGVDTPYRMGPYNHPE